MKIITVLSRSTDITSCPTDHENQVEFMTNTDLDTLTYKERLQYENRKKIINTAKDIIANDGLKKLTMRHLADKAGISSRTPYNLFTSKTGVLVALLEESISGVFKGVITPSGSLVLEALLHTIDEISNNLEGQHDFLRDVYWGLMSSDDMDTRKAAIDRGRLFIAPIIEKAIKAKELNAEVQPVQIDYENKRYQFLPSLNLEGSEEEIIQRLRLKYDGIKGKRYVFKA